MVTFLARRWAATALALACGFGLLLTVRSLAAQGAATGAAEFRRLKQEAMAILRSGKEILSDAEKETLDKYYQLALGRWRDPDKYGELPTYREELVKELRSAAGGGREWLVDRVAQFIAQALAEGSQDPPVVQYNAMLLLGEWNPSARAPLLPAAKALPILARGLGADASDAIQSAALIALPRYAPGLSAAQAGSLVRRLAGQLSAPPPTGRSAEAHGWILAASLDVLGALRQPGDQGEIALAIAKIVADPKMPPLTRLAAARALGSLVYRPGTGLNGKTLAAAVAWLLVDACDVELARYVPADAALGLGGRHIGPIPGEDAPDDTADFRRSLRMSTAAARDAIGRGSSLTTPATGLVSLAAATPNFDPGRLRGLLNALERAVAKPPEESVPFIAGVRKTRNELLAEATSGWPREVLHIAKPKPVVPDKQPKVPGTKPKPVVPVPVRPAITE